MRILATALTLGFGLTSEAVESVIDRVELHRSGATITRVVDVDLTPEAPQIGVEGLPANIDNQLRIHAAAGVEIRGVAVDIVRDTRAYNDAVTAKQNEIDIVETEIARLNDDSRIARLKLSFLQDAAAPENAEQIRPIDTWSETLDTLDRAATDAYARVRVNTAAIADQQRVLAKLIEELDALSGANSSSATVRFQATSSSSRRARIELSYYDHRAFWEPVYDASLDTRQRVLALDQRAQVSQWTGEDWTNVALVLGRNSPTSRADPPTVTSQFVTIAPPMYATRARQDNAVEEVVVTGNFALARAQPLSDRQQDLARLDTDFVARYVLPDRHSIPANRDKPRDVDTPSKRRLRRMALKAQGLGQSRKLGRGRAGVVKALDRIRYVQIDTISVVSRAHDHVLGSRVGGYVGDHLNQLLKRREAFEYWMHAASYRPITDFRFARRMMRRVETRELPWARRRDPKVMQYVLDRIRAEGPLLARDFEDTRPGKAKGWWDWKPTKLALDGLFLEGKLTADSRDGFQKRYELTERFLPDDVDTSDPTLEELADYCIDWSLDAHAFATATTMTYGQRDRALNQIVKDHLDERAAQGSLVSFKLGNVKAWARPDDLDRAVRVPADQCHILSPFDNLVIQRDRGTSIFDFDYTIECYVPEAKRQYGYYVLPIVLGDAIVGRMDCKAHRDKGRFDVKALYLEPSVDRADWERFITAWTAAVRDYAAANNCHEVVVDQAPHGLRAPLQRALA